MALRNCVKKANSREMLKLEQELVVYKGPIPPRCIPSENEPPGFFNVEQKMNMSDMQVEFCK